VRAETTDENPNPKVN